MSIALPLRTGMQQNWQDQIVVVTGGGGGMGQSAAKRFAEAGATTYVLGRTLESLQEVAATSELIHPLVCDVADAESVASAMETIGTLSASATSHTSG